MKMFITICLKFQNIFHSLTLILCRFLVTKDIVVIIASAWVPDSKVCVLKGLNVFFKIFCMDASIY
jgi:hypothetical protein